MRRGELEPIDRSGPGRDHRPGDEVLIKGGVFRGKTGVVEDVLPSGKLRILVRSVRTHASARVDPSLVEPLGIQIEGEPVESEEDEGPRALE